MNEIIDFHQHLVLQKLSAPEERITADDEVTEELIYASAEELVKAMEENGVVQAVLHGLPNEVWCYYGNNECVAKVVKKYPDRFIGSVHIYTDEVNKSKEIIKEYVDKGFRSVKIMPPLHSCYPDDPLFSGVFELINKLKLMVLFHMGELLSGKGQEYEAKYAHPIYIEKLARLYPETTFILAHMGGIRCLEGMVGYKKGFELINKYPNVYMDCSSTTAYKVFLEWNENRTPLDFSKIMWGSDVKPSVIKERIEKIKEILTEIGLETEINKIFYQNGNELLSTQSVAE
ncbi:MAG: amidohydrolase [Verrucomicrobia bacterium]|nr:amidohydrolase [Verrucomicrobiota bacterium]MBU4290463.1 amidohydrolase [Verrucomicrobiota bacterium]MBU4430053.1 amidohydrolase [Verrucomicrobiota bacterium]MCG2681120.1 amidohydrolase [Kiritimatiellia bacterium]